jgi:hypothetical protein
MAEKRELPQGQTFINMKGDIKAVVTHLAFDTQMQTQMGFFPCDEYGIRIPTPEVTVAEVKKNLAVVDREVVVEKKEVVVIIPEGANINPLEENPYEAETPEAKIYELHIGGMNEAEIKQKTGANLNTIRKVVKAKK